MALSREDSPFQCGISVAPVADWRLYSSVYSERYMGDYNENREWYGQDSSLLYDTDPLTSKASLITKYGKKYFLAHGTGDNNVHFRHSALWEQRLIEAGDCVFKSNLTIFTVSRQVYVLSGARE